MLWLERGDRLPTVAWLQNALNADPAVVVKHTVDGDYGKQTYEAVKRFQKRHDLPVDGVAGPRTCEEILKLTDHQIVNFVDDSDSIWFPRKGGTFGQHALCCIMKMGGDLILSIPNQDGRQLILNGLARRAAVGKVALLRIYSHGKTAQQNLTLGRGGYHGQQGGHWDFRKMKFVGGKKVNVLFSGEDGGAMNSENMSEAMIFMSKLSRYFAPLGSLELHGCKTARGRKGQSFIARLALAGGIPVTGAIPQNFVAASKPRTTLRVDKPSFTFFPLSMDLKTWSKSKVDSAALAK